MTAVDEAPAPTTEEIEVSRALLSDREWRLDNLYKIRDDEGRAIKFVRRDVQRQFDREMWYRNLIPKARKLGFCHDPNMRVLTADLRWVRIDDLKIGQEIVAVDEEGPGGKGNSRKMRLAIVEAKRDVEDVAYRVKLDSGVELIATAQHRYLAKRESIKQPKWKTVADLKLGDGLRYITQPWNDDVSHDDGWIAGMLDGEGSLRPKQKGGFEACIAQTEGPTLDRARKYLIDRGYSFREDVDARTYERAYGGRTKPLHKLVISRMNEAFRLIGQTRPTRFIDRRWWKDKDLPGKKSGAAWSTIISLERLDRRRMVDIQTSAKTFICEGIVSHNSTGIGIFILDECFFRGGTVSGIVDRTLDDAKSKLQMIRYAYDSMPASLRNERKLVRANDSYIELDNGSSISVGLTYRGDTPRIIHVSEYGKISVDSPEHAKEIYNGAILAVPQHGFVFIESTAHGNSGKFCEMVREADATKAANRQLTFLDFKSHFFGWHRKPEYRIQNNLVIVTAEMREYFAELMAKHGVKLDADQMAWYQKQYTALGPDDIKQEFPSSADELFYSSLEGAYWRRELTKARLDGRIGGLVPHDPTRRVNTFWDIGEDCTAIWFHQTDGVRHRFIDYYEEEGGSLQSACGMVDKKRAERGFIYQKHYGPHDLEHKDWANKSRTRVESAKDLGVEFTVVPRIDDKADSIEAARRMLAMSWFDQEHCSRGVEALDSYRKRWNERMGVFISEPVHDWASHPADAIQQGAMGLQPEKVDKPRRHSLADKPRATSWSA
jgi:hypothetical protein